MARINPEFSSEIEKFGAVDFTACYNCGNCTAVCPLVQEEDASFPRRMLRYTLLGLNEDIETSIDPWLCYYCGDCSETCPRQSNPGEMMMSLRRYLISFYDWTGLSRILFTSRPALIGAFILTGSLVLILAWAEKFNVSSLMHFGHLFEMIAIISVASLILIPNILRMFYGTVLKDKIKIPLSVYITEFRNLVLHLFTQKKSLKCSNHKLRWFEHLLIVLGYQLLLFTTVFLNWLTTENTIVIHLGYVVSGVVFIFSFHFILGRMRGKDEINKYSHSSDWLFVIWLFMMGFSTFLVRLFIDLQSMDNILWLYIIHLIVLAQWALILVPFGKWTHFLYRPFAIYFSSLRNYAATSEIKNRIT